MIFNFFKILLSFTWISSLKLWSTFDNGSSSNKRSGWVIRDLARDALCDSPALISCGNLFNINEISNKSIIP